MCDNLSAVPHRISFFPADSGGRISCDVNIKTELVSRNDDNGVFVDHAAGGVQVDFGRFWMIIIDRIQTVKLLEK